MSKTFGQKEKEKRSKDLAKLVKTAKNEDIIGLVHAYEDYDLTGIALGTIFERLYVNDAGFSKPIMMDELIKIHHSFRTVNGATWNRTDNGYLAKRYNVINYPENGPTLSVKCDGPKKNEKANAIRKDIWENVRKRRCVILDITTKIEVDHKDGMKDDWKVADSVTQTLEDFQPLCKTANIAKRDHCKACKKSGKRYDATRLGYSVPFLWGDENTKSCKGCYWFDPVEFNKIISENYNKKS